MFSFLDFSSVDLSYLIYKSIFAVAILSVSLFVAMYSTWGERKFAALLQDRRGPNRAGPFGILIPLFDGGKLFFKEEIIPGVSNKFLFILGPCIAMTTALMTGSVIPWGDSLIIGDKTYPLQLADLNIAVLYVFAVVSLGVYGVMIGGWASNNKYSLLGALRASSQMISYEIAMGLSIVGVIMISGTLSLREIAAAQTGWHWNIFYQPLGFLIFIVCAFAECNRHPFDLAECESELVGGYHTEYSSMKLGFYLFAEYINVFISSAIIATVYFGGYNFPFISHLGWSHNLLNLLGMAILFLKIGFFVVFFWWVRWSLPRFRFDQLMNLGWKTLIPLALINILFTSLFLLWKDGAFK